MDNAELYGPRFLRPPSYSAASARRSARGTASVTGKTFTVHLRWTELMETQLTAAILDSSTAATRILYLKTGVSHSYCFSNCLRSETI